MIPLNFLILLIFSSCTNVVVSCVRFQVLATAADEQTKEETQNIKSGRRVTVTFTSHWEFVLSEIALIHFVRDACLSVLRTICQSAKFAECAVQFRSAQFANL